LVTILLPNFVLRALEGSEKLIHAVEYPSLGNVLEFFSAKLLSPLQRPMKFSGSLPNSVVLHRFCHQGKTGKMQETRRLAAIPMDKPRGGCFRKGYSLVDKRISLVYILLLMKEKRT